MEMHWDKNKMSTPKFNFKDRVKKESKNEDEAFPAYIDSYDIAIEINRKGFVRGSSKTVDLICELLESDEAFGYNNAEDSGKSWADFIRKHCKE